MNPGFVSISRFLVRNGMESEVASAFRARPHSVDSAPGFIRMDVPSPSENDSEFWVVSDWSDAESFEAWHHSHRFRDSHPAIPQGLKLDAAGTELRGFRHITS